MKAITILEVAEARGIQECESGGYSLGSFQDLGLSMLGGCKRCQACITAYNACPAKDGYWRCSERCIGEDGFPSVRAFELWEQYQEELAQVALKEEQQRELEDKQYFKDLNCPYADSGHSFEVAKLDHCNSCEDIQEVSKCQKCGYVKEHTCPITLRSR